MQLELIDLLRQKEICHPTKIQNTKFDQRAGSIILRCFPWWLDDRDGIDEAEISFHFGGIEELNISENWLGGDEYCEDLEEFTVEQMNEQEWAIGNSVEIYCNSPLQDKFAVLAAVDCFLVSSGCPYELDRFLNMSTIRDFGKITSTSSYQICSGPKVVCDKVVTELVRQKVRHSVIEHLPIEDNRLLVKMRDGYIVCQSAIATY